MDKVYLCLTEEHAPGLVLLAAMICLVGAWTALKLCGRSLELTGPLQAAWLAAAAVVAGCTIWATHFIGMLAYEPEMPIGYHYGLTVISMLMAMLMSGLAFAMLHREAERRLPAVGAVLGLGIAAMHFTGMAAIRSNAVMQWDTGLILTALAVGVSFSIAALRVSLGTLRRLRTLEAGGLLTVAVVGLHFIAMGAFRLEVPLLTDAAAPQLPKVWLAAGIAGATIVVIAFAIIAMVVDQHLADRTLRDAERLRALVDAPFEGIFIHEDGRVVDLNSSLARLIGATRDELIGSDLLARFGRPDQPAEAAAGARRSEVGHETELLRADGRRIPVEVLRRDISYDGRPMRVVAVRDISERRAAEARIRHLAHHDLLTDLPNRTLFRDRLEQALARVARTGEQLAVLCLDLDRFKEVNDLYGHDAGDTLLREVALTLKGTVRITDTLARLGGDEFAIVQIGPAQPHNAADLAERLVESLGRTYDLGGVSINVGVSIGMAIYPDDGQDSVQLLSKADMALYRAKADGRGTFRAFEPGMDVKLQARRTMERELRDALAQGRLCVHYQPQACAVTGAILGFEALVRWPHPERGMIPPIEFIGIAEESGLIRVLGEQVLRIACADATT